jgi:uncharacterized protein (DUF1501 family)
VINGARGSSWSGKPERQAFFVSQAGLDAHDRTVRTQLGLEAVNDALASFVKEMKLTGAWDDVVVVACQDHLAL